MKVLSVLAVVMFVILGWFIYLIAHNNNQFNAWNADCNKAGGIISQTHQSLFDTRYECFVDGEKVVLPGWEWAQ